MNYPLYMSYLHDNAHRPGAAADKATPMKSSKYCDLAMILTCSSQLPLRRLGLGTRDG